MSSCCFDADVGKPPPQRNLMLGMIYTPLPRSHSVFFTTTTTTHNHNNANATIGNLFNATNFPILGVNSLCGSSITSRQIKKTVSRQTQRSVNNTQQERARGQPSLSLSFSLPSFLSFVVILSLPYFFSPLAPLALSLWVSLRLLSIPPALMHTE